MSSHARHAASSFVLASLLGRSLRGLALSSLFGLAIGARYGLASMLAHAAGVPLGLAFATGMGAPALSVAVAHFDLPADASRLAEATVDAIERSGRVLSGLAPAALLLTVTPESPFTAALFAAAGLSLGGLLGARELFRRLQTDEHRLPRVLTLAFVAFAALLAARVWWLALPMLGRSALVGNTL